MTLTMKEAADLLLDLRIPVAHRKGGSELVVASERGDGVEAIFQAEGTGVHHGQVLPGRPVCYSIVASTEADFVRIAQGARDWIIEYPIIPIP